MKEEQENLTKIFAGKFLETNKKGWLIHILEPEPEGELGGADTHVLELAYAQMQKSDWQPLVVVNQNQHYVQTLKKMGIHFLDGSSLKYFEFLRQISNLPLVQNIGLVHSHGYDANYITYFIRKLNPRKWGKLPLVMTCHGWVENNFKNKIKTFADFYTYSTANGLIVCSPESVDRLVNFTKKQVEYIPNGVLDKFAAVSNRTDLDSANFKKKYHIPENKKLIAYIGRLSEEKRVDVYLKACREISRFQPNVHFLVIGSGGKSQSLKELATNLQIQEKITFTGFVADIENVYPHLSAVLLTSDTEGTPRVLIEAMSNAIPIIATDVGGVKSLVFNGENGFLSEKGNFHSIAKNTIHLLENKILAEQSGAKGRQLFEEYFSVWKMQKSIEDFYVKVLNTLY
jgi:L-malate glycosyltransferase